MEKIIDTSIAEHLREHVPYELLMLRYTASKMISREIYSLDWNAYLESFAVHARNLVLFLSDDSDQKDFRLSDITHDYKFDQNGKGLFQKLQSQVFHLSKSQTNKLSEKFDAIQAFLLKEWIELQVERF